MKERFISRDRAVIANDQSPIVAKPREGALDFPTTTVATQGTTVLRPRFAAIPAMRRDQFNALRRQLRAQWIAVVGTVGNDAPHPRTWLAAPTPLPHADRGEGLFRQPDFVRGRREKLLSQRNTLAVDHHHPLRALAPLGFADFRAPFLAGAKLPSRKDSLQSSCSRWFSSARNVRQMVSQTSCSSQSRSLRQQVDGEGNSSGRSHQRAPLRRTHKMPSTTLRSFAGGRPPFGRLGRWGSKGRIFSHWASVNRRPYRAIGPPLALLSGVIAHLWRTNYHRFKSLFQVLK